MAQHRFNRGYGFVLSKFPEAHGGKKTDASRGVGKQLQQVIPRGHAVLVAGDLHGHVENFRQLLIRADLANHPRRHFVLQEVLHGPFLYPGGGEKSHQLLDLVAAHFDNVVIDVPRTWFHWTDSVLIGSNRLFLVTEMTVPGLKHARHLVNVIRERLPDGPPLEVIVNRFEQRLFGPGLRRADIEQALGQSLAATIPNNFRLVSEAIDRGVPLEEVKPGNNIQQALSKVVFPPKPKNGAKPVETQTERKLALVR